MITDEYGIVFNCEENYKCIAVLLNLQSYSTNSAFFAWTDGEGSQLDILITYHNEILTPFKFQRGLHGNELFVSIIGIGCFGFDVDADSLKRLHPNYVGRKLGIPPESITTKKLTDLIKGIGEKLCRI